MTSNPQATSASRTARILHGAVTGALVVTAVIFIVLRDSLAPQMRSVPPVLAIALAAIAVGQIVIAFAVFRGRIPARRYDQSVEGYWSDRQVRTPSLVLWALLEAAGVLSTVGFLISGNIVTAVVALLALVALVSVRPARLEAE